MSNTKPGADELRMARILRQRGVGPDAMLPTVIPPIPAQRPRDWLDDILDSNPAPAPKPEPAKAPTAAADPVPPDDDEGDLEPACQDATPTKPRRRAPRQEKREAARQSLLDAWDNVPRRMRWLIHHATAAAAGWPLGWVDWGTDTAAWYAAGHWTTPTAWVLYGLGGCVLGLYRRSRAWAWPAAWAAAVPVSSVAAGVLLYGTGYQP
jgi:hypothetical protein